MGCSPDKIFWKIITIIAIGLSIAAIVLYATTRSSSSTNFESASLVWNQTATDSLPILFNANESRAIPLQVVKEIRTPNLLDVDPQTGFITYLGSEDVVVNVNYLITVELPAYTSLSIQHFIGLDPNETWLTVNPDPAIVRSDSQTYSRTAITVATESTITTIPLVSSFTLHPNQSFGLCANIQDTNALTVYKHVSCVVSI